MTEDSIQIAYSVIDFDFNTYIVQSEGTLDEFRPVCRPAGKCNDKLVWDKRDIIKHNLATMIYDAFNVTVTPVKVLRIKPLGINSFVDSVIIMDRKIPNPNNRVLEASCVFIPKGYVNGPQNYLPDCMYESNVYVVNKGNIDTQKKSDLDQILTRI